jgi:signal transduction histidine kinase/ActR/RegA family two-component response regulator
MILRFILALGVISLLTSPLMAEELNRDSLLQVWNDTTSLKIDRLEAVYQLCEHDIGGQPKIEAFLPAVVDALTLAREIKADSFYTRYLVALSAHHILKNEFDKGRPYILEAPKYKTQAKDPMDAFTSFFNILYLTTMPDNTISGDSLIKSELAEYEDPENGFSDSGIASVYSTLGMYYTMLRSDYPVAMTWYKKAEDLNPTRENRDEKFLSLLTDWTINKGRGTILYNLQQFDEAERYLQKALALSHKLNNPNLIYQEYTFYTNLLRDQGRNKEALLYVDSAMSITPDCDCENLNEVNQVQKASILINMGKFTEGRDLLLSVEDVMKQRPGFASTSAYYYYLGKAFLSLKEYDQAINYAAKGIGLVPNMNLRVEDHYHVISQAWEAKGNYQKAFQNYRQYVQIKDSLSEIRNNQEVTRREMENTFQRQRLADSLAVAQQTLARELEFQGQLNQEKTRRNIIIGLGIAAFLLAIGLYSRLQYIRKTQRILEEKNRIIESEKEKAQASEQAKQTFLANMSHEIRTPMNAIKGMTDILLRRNPVDEQLGYLRAIKESSHSLLVIINDILDISKLEAGKVELEEIDFSLEKVLDNVKTIMGFKAEEKSLSLEMNIVEGTPRSLNGDPTRLHQILINLVGNAIKFTEEGRVRVKVDAGFQNEKGKKRFRFSVIDSGIGMDADRIDKIFKSFEQAYADTSRKYGGTGLGLSISKQLVELQGGKIWVESEKGQGSAFHFEIPYAVIETVQEKVKEEHKLSSAEVAAKLKGIRVLLVEDNQFNAIVAQEELEDSIEEVEVVVAENGEIAVEKIKNKDFDIVLMDVQMPVMNGYESTREIRGLENGKAQTPIIAMTANVMKEEVERCYDAGMNDFIGKPFEVPELLLKIKQSTKR